MTRRSMLHFCGSATPLVLLAVGGAPRLSAHALRGNGSLTHTMHFEPDHTVQAHVHGNAGSHLAMYVYNHDNDLIAHDDDGGQDCDCSFHTDSIGEYRIRISNLDHHPATYELTFKISES